jgi:hypothetical protein
VKIGHGGFAYTDSTDEHESKSKKMRIEVEDLSTSKISVFIRAVTRAGQASVFYSKIRSQTASVKIVISS